MVVMTCLSRLFLGHVHCARSCDVSSRGVMVVVATCSSRSSCGVFVARFATSFSGVLLGRSSHSFLRCMCSSRSLLGSVHCVHLAKSSCCFVAMLSCCFVATSLCSFCCNVVVARSASFLFL